MKKSVYDGSDFVHAQRLNLIAAVLGVLIAVIAYYVRGEVWAVLISFAVVQSLASLIAAGFIGRGLERMRDKVRQQTKLFDRH